MNFAKKHISILIFITFIFSLNHPIFSQEKFEYSESIDFEINQIKKWSTIATGNGHYYTNKGYKYFMIYITFTNKSDKKQLVNFKDFFLIDIKEKIKYNVELSLANGPITWIYSKDRKKIKAKQIKKVKLAIVCPEDFNPMFLMLNNGKIIAVPEESKITKKESTKNSKKSKLPRDRNK